MRGAALWAVALVGLACFDPRLGERPFRCGAGSRCPAGYRCDGDGVCVRGVSADGRPQDGRPADAPLFADGRTSDARPDAPPPDARARDAAGGDAATQQCLAACTAASCAASTCGRSSCGYDCGDCPPTAIAEPCIDHYGQMLDEGGGGLRTCPAEPTRFQTCVCGGGGANAWTLCAGACTDEGCSRAGQIGCGFASCGPGEVCCRNGRSSFCSASSTAACEGLPVAACDGPEDCPGGVCCSGDLVDSARCVSGDGCGQALLHCHTTADCPVSAPLCCTTGLTSGSKACYATAQAGGCN